MKEKNTQYTINEFFEEFKNLPNSYGIEKVHQLLNNPNAKAMHKVNFHFKHLKLIIMTSTIIIGIAALLFLKTQEGQVKMDSSSDGIKKHIEYPVPKTSNFNSEKISDSISPEVDLKSSKGSKEVRDYENTKSEISLVANAKIEETLIDSASVDQSLNKNELIANPIKPKRIVEKEIPNIEVPVLNLSKSEMANLGFVFYKDSVVFTFNDKCNKYTSVIDSCILDFKNDSAKIIDKHYFPLEQYEVMKNKGVVNFAISRKFAATHICGKMSLHDNSQILIRCLTKDKTSEFIRHIWNYDEDMKDGCYPQMTINDVNLNLLVPIKCSSKDSELELFLNEQVFWMVPNDELFARLPKNISEELRKEFNLLKSENIPIKKNETSCTYYESCKSTLQLDNLKLYPNPAKYSATIEYDLPEDIEGSISIFNLSGIKLKTFVPNSTFLSGHNSYELDLSGIAPGIYLIAINTSSGFKTQRLIVSQ